MGDLKWVKTKEQLLADKPILTDDGRLIVYIGAKAYEIKIGLKGECKYYETNISNLQRNN